MPAMAPALMPPLVTNEEVVSDADADDPDRVGAKSEDWVGAEGAKSEDMEEGICVAVEGRATVVLPDVTEPVPDPDDDRLGLVLTMLEDVVGA